MAESLVVYAGNGTTTDYTVPFPYISRTHVQVQVNLVTQIPDSDYYWLTDGTVRFITAPILDAGIIIRRVTPMSSRMVEFQNGAVLTEEELNLAVKQLFYRLQEQNDYWGGILEGGLANVVGGVNVSAQDMIDAAVQDVLNDALLAELMTRINDIDANAESILSFSTVLNQLLQATAAVVYVQATEPVPGVGGIPNPIAQGSRWYDTDDNNKPYFYTGGAWLSLEDPRIAANAAAITALQATVDNPTTGVVATATALGVLDTTVVNLDGSVTAIANDVTSLLSTVNNPTTGVAATASGLSALTTRVDTAEGSISSHTSQITALESTVNNPTTGVAATASGLSSLSTTVSTQGGQISAVAQDVTNLTTTVNGHTTSISTHTSSIDGLSAQYTVKVDNNGRVAGFGLASTPINGVPYSSFIVIADKFAIVDPASTGSAPKIPFVVTGGVVYMQNVVVQDALIQNLTVGKLTSGTFPNGQTFTHNGDLNVGTTGKVRGGMTDYASGTGFFLGYSGGAYKFSVGNSTKYIRWDGSTFSVGGDIIATGNIIDGAVTSQDYQVTTTAQNPTENVETTVASCTVTTVAGKPVALSSFWNFTTFCPVPYNSPPITTFKLKRGSTVLLTWTYTGVYSSYDVARFWIDNPGAGTFNYTITALMRADPNGDNGTPQTRTVHYIALEARQLKK